MHKSLTIFLTVLLFPAVKATAQQILHTSFKPRVAANLPYAIPAVEDVTTRITAVKIEARQVQVIETKPKLKINASSGQCALLNEMKSSLYLQGKRSSAHLVNLKWEVKQLYNKRGFEIQRSFNDTTHFITVGFVQAYAQSQPKEIYASIDLNENIRPAYYRLKQMRKDTGYTYSNIVLVNGLPQFNLFPNPVADVLNIKLQCTENSQVSFIVYDNKGVQVIKQHTNLIRDIINTKTIKVHSLPAGMYNLQVIHTDTTLYSEKFIKE